MKVSKFYKEVKSEATRIAWPSKKETMSASALVLCMALVAGLFFLVVDAVVYKVIHFILGL